MIPCFIVPNSGLLFAPRGVPKQSFAASDGKQANRVAAVSEKCLLDAADDGNLEQIPDLHPKIIREIGNDRRRFSAMLIDGEFGDEPEIIGEGGSCRVYKLTDRLGELYALKVMFDSKFGNVYEQNVGSHLATRVRHPGVVVHEQIYYENSVTGEISSLPEDNGQWRCSAILFPYIEGMPLNHRWNEVQSQPQYIFSILKQVTSALRAISQAGIRHNDLNARNIIITPDFHAKIIDFGLSIAIEGDMHNVLELQILAERLVLNYCDSKLPPPANCRLKSQFTIRLVDDLYKQFKSPSLVTIQIPPPPSGVNIYERDKGS